MSGANRRAAAFEASSTRDRLLALGPGRASFLREEIHKDRVATNLYKAPKTSTDDERACGGHVQQPKNH